MPKSLVAEEGKEVMVHVKKPISLYNFETGRNEQVSRGDYPATWQKNPYHPQRPSLVLILDDLKVGGVDIYWKDPISKNQVTITDI